MKKVGIFLIVVLVLILALGGTGTSVYFFNKYKSAEKKLREASIVAQEDVKSLVDKVGKLIKLPEGEIPTVATISNLDKLKEQPFFAKANIGDRVLLYTQAKKAILYDPINNKIVEVGPLILPTPSVSLGSTEQAVAGITAEPLSPTPLPKKNTPTLTPQQNEEKNESIKIAVYNGTPSNKTENILKTISEKIGNSQIIEQKNASNINYAKTILVDISEKYSSKTGEWAKAIGAEISAIPSEEIKPKNADILIIIGINTLNSQ